MTNIRTGGLLISLGVAGALALAACGGGGGGGGGNTVPADALAIDALDIKFDKEAYDAPAGEVTIAYDNKGALVHDLLVYDEADTKIGATLRVSPGDLEVDSYDLPAGTYSLICDIPGHENMKATLTTS